jgi:hypothetical protein
MAAARRRSRNTLTISRRTSRQSTCSPECAISESDVIRQIHSPWRAELHLIGARARPVRIEGIGQIPTTQCDLPGSHTPRALGVEQGEARDLHAVGVIGKEPPLMPEAAAHRDRRARGPICGPNTSGALRHARRHVPRPIGAAAAPPAARDEPRSGFRWKCFEQPITASSYPRRPWPARAWRFWQIRSPVSSRVTKSCRST